MLITLWNKEIPLYNKDYDTPNFMTTYLINCEKPLPCVVILPGGGYCQRCSGYEGKDIAEFFNSRGMNAAVVEYRVSPNRYPTGLLDAQRAIRILRANADLWGIDPERIVILGFSAGGHLAGCVSNLPDSELPSDYTPDETDKLSSKVNGAVLCYPVINISDEYGHMGSGDNLLGKDHDKDISEYLSLENRVNGSTPPTFLMHTSEDNIVNVKNSLIYAERLRDNNVPFEMHIFPKGQHGIGLGRTRQDARIWPELAADFIIRNI